MSLVSLGQFHVWWCKSYHKESRRNYGAVILTILNFYSVDGRCVSRKRKPALWSGPNTLLETSVLFYRVTDLLKVKQWSPSALITASRNWCGLRRWRVRMLWPSHGQEYSGFRLIFLFIYCLWNVSERFIYACFIGMIGTFWIADDFLYLE